MVLWDIPGVKLQFDVIGISFCAINAGVNARLPHLRGLQIFEAVARHRNMTRAGEELAIGQSAATQQVRRLEHYFGMTLVEREPGGVHLTDSGEFLARRLRLAMDDIRAVVAELIESQRQSGSISVVALGAFAYRWLIPRLPSFHLAHPEVDIKLIAASTLSEVDRGDVDVSIRSGNGRWRGCRANYLMANQIFPVVSPRLCLHATTPQPQDLEGHSWIHIDAEPRRSEWRTWTTAIGCPTLQGSGEIHVSSSIHAIEAAIAGLGVALGHTPFVWDALRAGNLVAVEPALHADEGDYYIVSPDTQAESAKVCAFRVWLLEQV